MYIIIIIWKRFRPLFADEITTGGANFSRTRAAYSARNTHAVVTASLWIITFDSAVAKTVQIPRWRSFVFAIKFSAGRVFAPIVRRLSWRLWTREKSDRDEILVEVFFFFFNICSFWKLWFRNENDVDDIQDFSE